MRGGSPLGGQRAAAQIVKQMKFDRIADERIRRALAEGKFDNLAGAGKPIEWRHDNPHAGEWQLAYDMLENAGMAPRWIEIQSAARRQMDSTCAALAEARRRWNQHLPAWELACARFRDRMGRVNQAIRLHNLIAPGGARPLSLIDPEREIVRIRREVDTP